MEIKISQKEGCHDLPMPRYQTPGSAGMDLPAAVDAPAVLEPGAFMLVPTGLFMAIPPGYEGQVRPRSGLALRHGIGVLNGPGTIDSDYRGEVGVILFNFSSKPFIIKRGERIAQLVIARVEQSRVICVPTLDQTGRNSGGFGSTGR